MHPYSTTCFPKASHSLGYKAIEALPTLQQLDTPRLASS